MLTLVLVIAGMLCFALATIGIPGGRINLIAAGLLCWIVASAFLPLVGVR
jgi:hypothetical protein